MSKVNPSLHIIRKYAVRKIVKGPVQELGNRHKECSPSQATMY